MVKKELLSIVSPTRDASNEKNEVYMRKFVRKETEKRRKVIESDQTSLLINKGKRIGKINKKFSRRKK